MVSGIKHVEDKKEAAKKGGKKKSSGAGITGLFSSIFGGKTNNNATTTSPVDEKPKKPAGKAIKTQKQSTNIVSIPLGTVLAEQSTHVVQGAPSFCPTCQSAYSTSTVHDKLCAFCGAKVTNAIASMMAKDDTDFCLSQGQSDDESLAVFVVDMSGSMRYELYIFLCF